jgi:hypothetical protein
MSHGENLNYNNISATTTDLHAEELANPEKLVNNIQYYDPKVYINNDNNSDDDDYHRTVDDAGNYTSNSDHELHEEDNNDIHNEEKKNVNNGTQQNSHSKNHSESESEEDSQMRRESDNNNNNNNSTEAKKFDPTDESSWSKEDMMLQKLELLRKLGELSRAGVKLSQNYSLNSDYKTMKFEYELHSNIRSKQNSIKWMSGMLVGIVKGVELLNDNMNPFDMKFDGMWSNEVQSDISNYYDILGEIYEKYTTPGKKMAPELRLFLMLTGSAVSIQMHKGIANFMASKSDVSGELENNPEHFAELRKKSEMNRMEQKKKMQEKVEEEHKAATDRMANINLMEKQHKIFNDVKKTSGNPNLFKSMVLSESATSYNKTKETEKERKEKERQEKERQEKERQEKERQEKERQEKERQSIERMNKIKQAEIIEKKREQQMESNKLKKEMQQLEYINNMIKMRTENEKKISDNDKKNSEKKREISAKVIKSESSQKQSSQQSSSQQSSQQTSSQQSSSQSHSESPSKCKNTKNNAVTTSKSNDNCSVASSASYMSKNPKFEKMRSSNTNSNNQITDSTSQVRQLKIVDNMPEITCSKSKESTNKQKGSTKKISTSQTLSTA